MAVWVASWLTSWASSGDSSLAVSESAKGIDTGWQAKRSKTNAMYSIVLLASIFFISFANRAIVLIRKTISGNVLSLYLKLAF
jgi:hypothetical protein